MPVNTAALKTFAPAMRRQLLEAVGRKLDLLLNSQTPDTLSTYAKQIAELREKEAENREQLLERVAYTWFNRLCALRYLDARGWHPFGCKVLMPAAEGESQPELLKLMRAGSLPAELKPLTNEDRLHGLLDGQIPPAISGADPQGEVYRELVLASCRSYHQLLPELFEGLDDASELLLPDDLLSEGSIAGGFRSAISDTDCVDVEIIGWLYQFYISEKKDQVIGKVVKSEDIPAATQLFTPNWIVKYMLQNSLGATWLATYPDSPLKGQMEFYIEPAKQTPEVLAQLAAITPESLDPEALTLIDPACGSGHILVEAYNLLKGIYLERGYRQRDIPELILTKNLHGLDICPRAAQLAAFSLLMKGREDDRRLLERDIQLNVMAFQDSTGVDVERLALSMNLAAVGLNRADLRMLTELFAHATTFGSLTQVPELLTEKLQALSHMSEQLNQDLFASRDLQTLKELARQAMILGQRYSSVVANPPYMGGKGLNPALRDFLFENYKNEKADLFSAFTARCSQLGDTGSRAGIMCPNVWMYLSAHQKLRRRLQSHHTLQNLVELPLNGFKGATVQICSYTFQNLVVPGHKSSYIRLVDLKGSDSEMAAFVLDAIKDPDCPYFFEAYQDNFSRIPGSPIAYWLTPRFYEIFESGKAMGKLVHACAGLQTGNNGKFLRFWYEVDKRRIGYGMASGEEASESKKRWYPCNKGGAFRRWSGNREYVVNWESNGRDIHAYNKVPMNYAGSPVRAKEFYFKPSVSWSDITSGPPSFRFFPSGFIHEAKGMSAFSTGLLPLNTCLAFCNTPIVTSASRALNPTLSFQVGNFEDLPFIESKLAGLSGLLENPVNRLVQMCSLDWDAFEASWDFTAHPLLSEVPRHQLPSISSAYEDHAKKTIGITEEVQRLEEEVNQLFINAYCLQDETSSKVSVEQITLTVNPAYRYGGNLSEAEQWERFRRDTMGELLSYAIGCMMGRYSLEQPGLILADSRDSQAAHLAAYEEEVGKPLAEIQFKPDPDAIIPVLDGEWFEDDIVARTREFLEVTFPESTVTENLRFIEESLGKDIRKYFCSDFYKDHLQTYKKRPIYWLVQSPKKGFACLIYLHRYTKDTLNQVLNNYFRPYLQKLEARLAQLGLDQLNDDLPTRERTAARKEAEKITKVLKECQAWEQDALLPLAQQRIELDLDDGVKVNYLKLQDVLAVIPGLAAKED